VKKEIVLKSYASLVAAFLSIVVAPTVVAFQPDPTKPSPLIGDRLRRLEIADEQVHAEPATANNDIVVLPMRLKGIVLSDDNHGTAIIEYNRSDIYRIPLQRTDPNERPKSIAIGGISFSVVGFSASQVVLQCLATDQILRVN